MGMRCEAESAGRGRFHFRVQDTGIGIPEDRIGRLFQAFKQVDASTRRRFGGTGLGLAISKRLTELMGGAIGVESALNVGTTFWFDVVLDLQASAQPVAIGGLDLDSKTLLILCDCRSTNCGELIRYAEGWGMAHRIAETPQEAAELFRQGEAFDAVLIDADQYPAGAPELAALLSSAGSTPRIAMVRRAHSSRKPAGFSTVVQKPFKPSLLYDAFVEVLAGASPKASVRKQESNLFDRGMAARAPLKILLADDHPTNQKLALLVLGRLGYAADTADNGVEALEAVARTSYDLILMDIHMPEMDGLEATQKITERRLGQWPRIVMMTANVLQSDLDKCMEAGAVDVVRKPIDVPKLISVLEETHEILVQPFGTGHLNTRKVAEGAVTEQTQAAGRIDDDAIDLLIGLIGGSPDMFAELVSSFQNEAPRLFEDLRAGAAGDADRLRIAAHTIKSSAGDFGATALAEHCTELERLGVNQTLEGAESLAKAATTEWYAVEQALLTKVDILREKPAEPVKDRVS